MEKINYEPVKKTGVLSSSIYDDGNTLTLGANTHLAIIEGGNKFAALEVCAAKDKSGNPIILKTQSCEDGNFAVLAISALKTKRVFSTEDVNSSKRLSGGMSLPEILSLESGVKYRLIKTETDGWKKPFGWVEGDPLVSNNSYRLEAVAAPKEESQPTAKK